MWVKCTDRLPPAEGVGSERAYRVIRRGRGQQRREDKLWWMEGVHGWGWYNLLGQMSTAVEEWEDKT